MAVQAPEREKTIATLVKVVRVVDPGVRDVVLIGSAVYAPELAKDYDLVVTSNSPQETRAELFGVLLDALNEAADKNVDVILRFAGDQIGDLARPILAGRVIFGDSETTKEAKFFFEERGGAVSSFNLAEAAIKVGELNLKQAEETNDPAMEDMHYRYAFNGLFDAGRIAALTYLGREDTRWGGVAQELPWPQGGQFKDMINTLHLFYSYDGNYPKDTQKAREEFGKWKEKVERFVGEMRQRTLERSVDEGPQR